MRDFLSGELNFFVEFTLLTLVSFLRSFLSCWPILKLSRFIVLSSWKNFPLRVSSAAFMNFSGSLSYRFPLAKMFSISGGFTDLLRDVLLRILRGTWSESLLIECESVSSLTLVPFLIFLMLNLITGSHCFSFEAGTLIMSILRVFFDEDTGIETCFGMSMFETLWLPGYLRFSCFV